MPRRYSRRQKKYPPDDWDLFFDFVFYVCPALLILLILCAIFLPSVVFTGILLILSIVCGYILSVAIFNKEVTNNSTYPFWRVIFCLFLFSGLLWLGFNSTKYLILFPCALIGSFSVGLLYLNQIFLNAKSAAILSAKHQLIDESRRLVQERQEIREQRLEIESHNNNRLQEAEGIGLEKKTKVTCFYQQRRIDGIASEMDEFLKKIENIDLSVFQNVKKAISDWLIEEKAELEKEKQESITLQKKISTFLEKKREEEENRQRQEIIERGRRLEAIHQMEHEEEIKHRMDQMQQERQYFKDLYLK